METSDFKEITQFQWNDLGKHHKVTTVAELKELVLKDEATAKLTLWMGDACFESLKVKLGIKTP